MVLAEFSAVAELTAGAIGADIVEEMMLVDEHTFLHGLATGAMAAEAIQQAGCNEELVAIAAIAGALHDTGKFSPHIQQLMRETEGQKFTPGQTALMRTHTTRGFLRIAHHLSLDRAHETSIAGVAAYTALQHHTKITTSMYRARPVHAGICHTVQLCDIAHARLFDTARTYREARDGRTYTPQQIGRQIIAQFADFPPKSGGMTVPVPDLVAQWVAKAAGDYNPGTLD